MFEAARKTGFLPSGVRDTIDTLPA